MVEDRILDGRTMGDNLRKARVARGLTQTEIAQRLDISLTAYQKIESGKTNIINKHYAQCAEELDVPLYDLVNGDQAEDGEYLKFEEAKVEYLSQIEQLSRQVALLENAIKDKDKIIHTQELLIEHLQK